MQEHSWWLYERCGLSALPQAQRDGRGGAGRRHQHRSAKAQLHEAVYMTAHDALDGRETLHNVSQALSAPALICIYKRNPAVEWRLVHHDDRGAGRLFLQPVLQPTTGLVVHIPVMSARDGDVEAEDAHRPVIPGGKVQRARPR